MGGKTRLLVSHPRGRIYDLSSVSAGIEETDSMVLFGVFSLSGIG
jgi:hypothetical protein